MEEKETYMEEKRYCRKCGAELKGQGKFCPRCGEPILSEEPPKAKKKGRKIAIITIGIIGILGVGTAVAYSYFGKQEEKKNHVTAVKEDNKKEETKENKEDFVETNEAENYLAIVTNKDGKDGLINAAGEWVLPCEYEVYSMRNGGVYDEVDVKDGLILVKDEDDKYGYMNMKGEEEIPCQYEDVGYFSKNGLAEVQKDGKWGFVNETGEEVIPCQYEDVEYFVEEGFAAVENSNGKWGCVDGNGKEVIPCQYDVIGGYRNITGYHFRVSENGLIPVGMKREGSTEEDSYTWSYVDTTGKEVISLPEEIAEAYCFVKVE